MKRDPYAVVGEAMRFAQMRAAAAKLSSGEWRVFNAVLWFTASWSKLTDRVTVDEIARRAGISHRHTTRCLAKLAEDEVVFYQPSRGRGRLGIVGLLPVDNSCGQPVEVEIKQDRLDEKTGQIPGLSAVKQDIQGGLQPRRFTENKTERPLKEVFHNDEGRRLANLDAVRSLKADLEQLARKKSV